MDIIYLDNDHHNSPKFYVQYNEDGGNLIFEKEMIMSKTLYILSDGWPAFLYEDGTLGDTPVKEDADLQWDSLEQIMQWDDETVKAENFPDQSYVNRLLSR